MVALFPSTESNSCEGVLIQRIHYRPDMLTEEQLKGSIMVEDVPEPEPREGYVPYLHCNPETKELWYEYEMVRPTEEERLEALESAMLALMFSIGGVVE